MAGLTGAVGSIEEMSNPAAALVKTVAMVLIIPGLMISAIIGGNLHAFSLGIAAAINGGVYFALSWLLYPLWIRLRNMWQH